MLSHSPLLSLPVLFTVASTPISTLGPLAGAFRAKSIKRRIRGTLISETGIIGNHVILVTIIATTEIVVIQETDIQTTDTMIEITVPPVAGRGMITTETIVTAIVMTIHTDLAPGRVTMIVTHIGQGHAQVTMIRTAQGHGKSMRIPIGRGHGPQVELAMQRKAVRVA